MLRRSNLWDLGDLLKVQTYHFLTSQFVITSGPIHQGIITETTEVRELSFGSDFILIPISLQFVLSAAENANLTLSSSKTKHVHHVIS